jgi:cation diffusion facilitator CzcD-associated flavoprotein CzcO
VNGTREFDVVVVGAGFAGLRALHSVREAGFSARVLERGSGVGGTWYWNRYPGARCDTPSLDYSYSFSPALQDEWDWSERYATQPEILRYLEHVADRFDLRRDIELESEVVAASFDSASARWHLETREGRCYRARFVIMATGNLSTLNQPHLEGIEQFRGRVLHTAAWPREGVDFSGRVVGVLGTGSTGIQTIPQIARHAQRLTVFQRTANFSLPARNRPLDADDLQQARSGYSERRRRARASRFGVPFDPPVRRALEVSDGERREIYDAAWSAGGDALIWASFTDTLDDLESNTTAAEFVRDKIRESVAEPRVAEMLMPTTHPIGTKRICIDTGYYETFNRANVELVDIGATPIVSVTGVGVQTSSELFPCDDLVFATGFDAITGTLLAIDIRGRDGVRLADAWREGPSTYLGVAVPGFPNMFIVTGPGSPSVLSNMVHSIEQHVDWITACMVGVRERGCDRVEALPEAARAWDRHISELAAATLFPMANSWYMGANIPGKPRRFMTYVAGVGKYRAICDEVAADDYRGFLMGSMLKASPFASPPPHTTASALPGSRRLPTSPAS